MTGERRSDVHHLPEAGVDHRGLVIVFTGEGKGKTLAAVGLALRASGHGMKTLMIQFLKGEGSSGEQNICPTVVPFIEIYPFGIGFVYDGDDPGPHSDVARKAWRFMEEKLKEDHYDILILDEFAVAVDLGLIDEKRLTDLLSRKSGELHVVITGRNATQEMIRAADVVTQMMEVKHIYHDGVPAVKGLDY